MRGRSIAGVPIRAVVTIQMGQTTLSGVVDGKLIADGDGNGGELSIIIRCRPRVCALLIVLTILRDDGRVVHHRCSTVGAVVLRGRRD